MTKEPNGSLIKKLILSFFSLAICWRCRSRHLCKTTPLEGRPWPQRSSIWQRSRVCLRGLWKLSWLTQLTRHSIRRGSHPKNPAATDKMNWLWLWQRGQCSGLRLLSWRRNWVQTCWENIVIISFPVLLGNCYMCLTSASKWETPSVYEEFLMLVIILLPLYLSVLSLPLSCLKRWWRNCHEWKWSHFTIKT